VHALDFASHPRASSGVALPQIDARHPD
jgi:hypothetical protein